MKRLMTLAIICLVIGPVVMAQDKNTEAAQRRGELAGGCRQGGLRRQLCRGSKHIQNCNYE